MNAQDLLDQLIAMKEGGIDLSITPVDVTVHDIGPFRETEHIDITKVTVINWSNAGSVAPASNTIRLSIDH